MRQYFFYIFVSDLKSVNVELKQKIAFALSDKKVIETNEGRKENQPFYIPTSKRAVIVRLIRL